jgi:nitroreductase/NAD-dependent dihydropyrimidine dehydrogenase PreA subunit
MMTIDKTRCVDCGACITACSMGIFRRGADGAVFAREKPCMDCYHCAAACPNQAVVTHDMSRAETYLPAPDSTLLRAIQSRRSVRHFTDALPDRAAIQRALDGASYAPSGKNEHKNRWTVVYGRERVESMYQLVLEWAENVDHAKHLVWLARKGVDPVTCGAPCLILGHNCLDTLNPQDDTVIATCLAEQLLVESGLGTCWSGYFRSAAQECGKIQQALGLPEGHRVFSVLMVGVPAEQYPNIPYRPAAEAHWVD